MTTSRRTQAPARLPLGVGRTSTEEAPRKPLKQQPKKRPHKNKTKNKKSPKKAAQNRTPKQSTTRHANMVGKPTKHAVGKLVKRVRRAGRHTTLKDSLAKHYIEIGDGMFKLKGNHHLDAKVASPRTVLTINRQLRLGTDFGGLETPSQALERLGIGHDLIFYCEAQKHLQQFVAGVFRPECIYADVLTRNTKTMESVDLFVLGPPCQAWSTIGLKMGIEDLKGRGILLFGSMSYIENRRPKVVVLENVLNLVHGFCS